MNTVMMPGFDSIILIVNLIACDRYTGYPSKLIHRGPAILGRAFKGK